MTLGQGRSKLDQRLAQLFGCVGVRFARRFPAQVAFDPVAKLSGGWNRWSSALLRLELQRLRLEIREPEGTRAENPVDEGHSGRR
jgi:hypothetical protein